MEPRCWSSRSRSDLSSRWEGREAWHPWAGVVPLAEDQLRAGERSAGVGARDMTERRGAHRGSEGCAYEGQPTGA